MRTRFKAQNCSSPEGCGGTGSQRRCSCRQSPQGFSDMSAWRVSPVELATTLILVWTTAPHETYSVALHTILKDD